MEQNTQRLHSTSTFQFWFLRWQPPPPPLQQQQQQHHQANHIPHIYENRSMNVDSLRQCSSNERSMNVRWIYSVGMVWCFFASTDCHSCLNRYSSYAIILIYTKSNHMCKHWVVHSFAGSFVSNSVRFMHIHYTFIEKSNHCFFKCALALMFNHSLHVYGGCFRKTKISTSKLRFYTAQPIHTYNLPKNVFQLVYFMRWRRRWRLRTMAENDGDYVNVLCLRQWLVLRESVHPIA